MEPAAYVEKTAEPAPARDERVTVDCCDLKRRYDQLKALRSSVEAVWREIEAYFAPLSSGGQPDTIANEGTVQWTRPDVWDSTAIDASEKLAASIHGSVTTPSLRWYGLTWGDVELRDDQESAEWLDDLAQASWQGLQDSDFNTEIASADQDLVRYGNTFVVEEVASELEWKGLDFECIPVREGYFEPDSRGAIERFYRRLAWTPGQILSECMKRGWECPEEIAKKARDGKHLGEPIEVVFAVFPRPEAQKELQRRHERNMQRAQARTERAAREHERMRAAARAGEVGTEMPPPEGDADEPIYPLAPHMRPIGYVYFLAENGERLGTEGGYYEMPVTLARWQKTAGSIWGHGQCHIALPTVKYLNGWMETEHQAAAKAVDPNLYMTERGLLSDPDSSPGGITIARSKDDVWTLESKADPSWAQTKVAELRGMVQRMLHNDELTLKDSPAMTAMEVRARYELMNRVLGSTLARIENDLLTPIVMITIGHLLRARQVKPMPRKVAAKYADGTLQFNIEYQGPLARSQRTDEVAAIERVIAFAAALLKMGVPVQVVLATIDVVQAIRDVAQRLGTPANLLKSDDEAKKAIAAFEEMQGRLGAASAAKTEGEAANAHAQAQLALRGPPPGGAAAGPVPAQPIPIVAPAYGPAAPFAQPAPAT